jgi:hypothetical protein
MGVPDMVGSRLNGDFLIALKWSARVLSIASVGLLLLFVFGGRESLANITFKEFVGFLFFPIGLICGLIMGWKKELLGGLIGIASVAGLYLVYGLLLNGSVIRSFWFLAFAAPAFLFAAYGFSASSRKFSSVPQ